MRNRRAFAFSSIVMPLLFGFFALLSAMGRPRFAAIRTVDVLQILGAGMLFGVALSHLALWIRERSQQAAIGGQK